MLKNLFLFAIILTILVLGGAAISAQEKADNTIAPSSATTSSTQSEPAAQQSPDVNQGPTTSGDASEILGKWSTGNVSMLQEKNLTTGQITSSNGSLRSYKFYPDGRFEQIGYMKSTMYGCTTDLFNDRRGKYVLKSSQITFVPSKNY